MRFQRISFLIFVFFLVLAAWQCKKKDPVVEEEEGPGVFQKKEMLVNMADQVILPNYLNFRVSLDSLIDSYSTFKSSGTPGDFQLIQERLHVACIRYQHINLFAFGPGEDEAVRVSYNIFPADTAKILSNIQQGTYNLSVAANIAAKGLPALDFLFNGRKDKQASITLFQNANQRKYVDDLLSDMDSRIDRVISSWAPYRETFVNNLSTDISSSIGFLVNQLNFELDYLKNIKVATPLGIRSGGSPLPKHSEAYFSEQSLRYALETLDAIENIYRGKSRSGNDGLGFDDYLGHLDIQHVDKSLRAAIDERFVSARQKLQAINGPFSEKVISDPSTVDAAYRELVRLLVLLKTDMPSGLGVLITYQDGDGD